METRRTRKAARVSADYRGGGTANGALDRVASEVRGHLPSRGSRRRLDSSLLRVCALVFGESRRGTLFIRRRDSSRSRVLRAFATARSHPTRLATLAYPRRVHGLARRVPLSFVRGAVCEFRVGVPRQDKEKGSEMTLGS